MKYETNINCSSKTISVVMCTYNGEKFISEQLQSILFQSRTPDELVVADDGSKDSTLDIVSEFAGKAPFKVRIIPGLEKPLGVSKNFERALSASTGEIIVLSDQDDVWHVDRLLRTEIVMNQSPSAGYCFSDAEVIDEKGVRLSETLWRRVGFMTYRIVQFNENNQVHALLNGSNFTYGMSMAIRRKALDCILPIEANSRNCTHDVWSALILSALGHNGIAVKECLVHYRQHSQQVAGAGGLRMNLWASIQRSLRSPRLFDRQLPGDLEAAARRVKSISPSSPAVDKAAKLIAGKAIHLRRRELAFQSSLPKRSIIILNELFSGRYGLFSASWRTAIRDLLS